MEGYECWEDSRPMHQRYSEALLRHKLRMHRMVKQDHQVSTNGMIMLEYNAWRVTGFDDYNIRLRSSPKWGTGKFLFPACCKAGALRPILRANQGLQARYPLSL